MPLSLSEITEEDLDDDEFRRQLLEDLKTELAGREFSEFVKAAWPHSDPEELVWNWHMDIICKLLQKVSEGKIKRLIINIPPGFGKSKLTAVLWLAWDWINHPSRYSIYATYAAGLSNKFAKAHRDLVKSDWFQARWGAGTKTDVYIDKDSTQKKQEFENNKGGGRFSTGKGGEVTGRRAHIILFDDLNKSQDATGKSGVIGSEIAKGVEYLSETLWTRRILTKNEKKKTAIVGICQRLHHADVAQWCIDKGDFVHLNLPMECIEEEKCYILEMPDGSFCSALGIDDAEKIIEKGGTVWWEDPRKDKELIFPQLIGREEVEELKESLGPMNAASQLQQKPTPTGGGKINIEDLREYNVSEMADKLFDGKGETLISVDTADGGKDWIVAQLWRRHKNPHPASPTNYYLVDQERFRGGIKKTIKGILDLHGRWPGAKKVLIEKAANGNAAIELLRDQINAPGLLVKGYKPMIDKEGRVDFAAPLIQEGRVFIPDSPMFHSLKEEIRQFPLGKHDDQVDSMSMALIWFLQNSAGNRSKTTNAILRYYRS